MSRLRMPWDYVGTDVASATTVPNAPTPEGEALGREMARLADGAEAEQLAMHPGAPVRCEDCAFRLGTVPNRCAGTLMDALKCAVEGEPFYCHEGVARGDEPTRVCAGAALLTKAFSRGAKERR